MTCCHGHIAHLCPGELWAAVSHYALYSLQRPGAPEQVPGTRTTHLRTEMGLERSHLSTHSAGPVQWWGTHYIMRQRIS